MKQLFITFMKYKLDRKQIKEFCKFKRITKKLTQTEWKLLKQFCHTTGIIQEFYWHGTDTLKEWNEYIDLGFFEKKLQKYVKTRKNPIHSEYLLQYAYSDTFKKAFHKYLTIYVK